MDLDTKLATMEADGLPLYLRSQQVLAPGHRHTAGYWREGWSYLHLTPPTTQKALRLLELKRCSSFFPKMAHTNTNIQSACGRRV
jgi:hypothetical protein